MGNSSHAKECQLYHDRIPLLIAIYFNNPVKEKLHEAKAVGREFLLRTHQYSFDKFITTLTDDELLRELCAYAKSKFQHAALSYDELSQLLPEAARLMSGAAFLSLVPLDVNSRKTFFASDENLQKMATKIDKLFIELCDRLSKAAAINKGRS